MKYAVMCVYDSKARVFFKPYFVSTVEVGQRAFAGAVADGSTEVSKFPADFSLYHLGSFDDEVAVFEAVTPAVNLGSGANYKGVANAS